MSLAHDSRHGHGRVHAKWPRLVGRHSHHAPTLRPAPHQHWQTAELRVIELLHAGIEGVQAGVHDVAGRRAWVTVQSWMRSWGFLTPHGEAAKHETFRVIQPDPLKREQLRRGNGIANKTDTAGLYQFHPTKISLQARFAITMRPVRPYMRLGEAPRVPRYPILFLPSISFTSPSVAASTCLNVFIESCIDHVRRGRRHDCKPHEPGVIWLSIIHYFEPFQALIGNLG